MHEKRPQIPLRPHRLSSFVTSEGQLPLRRQRRLGTLMDVIALRALECSDVKARAAAGDTRQRGVPRQLLHEQVPQAWLHQLQRKMEVNSSLLNAVLSTSPRSRGSRNANVRDARKPHLSLHFALSDWHFPSAHANPPTRGF
jgi:hypothetical protein